MIGFILAVTFIIGRRKNENAFENFSNDEILVADGVAIQSGVSYVCMYVCYVCMYLSMYLWMYVYLCMYLCMYVCI